MLAGLWAAVLIPATRGGREASYDGRSIQGFHTAMRVLSRRTPPADNRYLMAMHGDWVADGAPSPPAQKIRRRRRAILARLAWAAGLTLLAAVVLRGPWPVLHLVTDLALLGYAARLRGLARAEDAARRQARRAELARREAAHRATYEAAHPREAWPPAYGEEPVPAERRAAAG